MAGRLERMEDMLRACLGSETLAKCPELLFAVNRLAVSFTRTADSPTALWKRIDSQIFNAVYAATGGTMLVTRDDASRVRVSAAQIRELADRLLALAYEDKGESELLRDALFDLSRAGSFAAMRALCARFTLDEDDRAFLTQVLSENDQAV